jgi:hypothetical protein
VVVDHGAQPIGNLQVKRLLDDPHEALSILRRAAHAPQ